MADTNAINKRTLIGNWVEEMALNKLVGDEQTSTGHRLIYHDQGETDWKTTQRDTYTFDYSSKVTTRTALKNAGKPRAQLRERQYQLEAARLVQEQAEAKARQDAEEDKEEWLSNRPGKTTTTHLSSSNGMSDTTQTTSSKPTTEYKYKLDSTANAITFYSTKTTSYGVTNSGTPSAPFDKSTSFSKPLEEYLEGEGETR